MAREVMYDSVNAFKIPAGATLVAGYIDGKYAWTAAEWQHFPRAHRVEIAVLATTDNGRVIDCEKGDATPEQAVEWVKMRRASKVHKLGGPAVVYTDRSQWPVVRAAFAAAKEAEPLWWIADWTNAAHIPVGAVACQYRNTPGFDVSVVERGIF